MDYPYGLPTKEKKTAKTMYNITKITFYPKFSQNFQFSNMAANRAKTQKELTSTKENESIYSYL